ncbi:hypothetical protein BC835DRAFT_1399259 [Cytidiella melzeri]|nr:hypothetical protein BC835DRAFT_1399259 [Cytidiella melzeri]
MRSSAVVTLALLATAGPAVSVPVTPSIVSPNTPLNSSTKSDVGNSGAMEFVVGTPPISLFEGHIPRSTRTDSYANSAAKATRRGEPAEFAQLLPVDPEDDGNKGASVESEVANHTSTAFMGYTRSLGIHARREGTTDFVKLLARVDQRVRPLRSQSPNEGVGTETHA